MGTENNMIRILVQTNDKAAGMIARMVLGVVMLPHGLQKLVGMFGGTGFSASMGYFTNNGFPAMIGFLVIMGESFGALGLILGFLSRFAAFGIGLIMTGAIFLAHAQQGFFMNWSGNQQGEGFEYHLLALGLSFICMTVGSGRWSIDGAITKRYFAPVLRSIRLTESESELAGRN